MKGDIPRLAADFRPGDTVGSWTLLRPDPGGDHPRWWCRCACGYRARVRTWSLVRGKSYMCRRCARVGRSPNPWGLLRCEVCGGLSSRNTPHHCRPLSIDDYAEARTGEAPRLLA